MGVGERKILAACGTGAGHIARKLVWAAPRDLFIYFGQTASIVGSLLLNQGSNPCLLTVSPVPGILQARTLEWVAISFSNA